MTTSPTALAGLSGPAWTTPETGRFPGRFPLSVERHVMSQVGKLLPGVTAVTSHARYYALHSLVAATAEIRNLDAAQTKTLMRRCEVVLGAISTAHLDPHPGVPRAHGGEVIATNLRETGGVDVADLAAVGRYNTREWGFWGPYSAPERELGLLSSHRTPSAGPTLNKTAVTNGLGAVLDLADADRIEADTLTKHQELCLCGSVTATDGIMLRELLLPDNPAKGSSAERRYESIRLILRLMSLADGPVVNPTSDLTASLLHDDAVAEDDIINSLTITPAWTGLLLRNHSVAAWRNLWSWLVDEIGGIMTVRALGGVLADYLPSGTVAEFRTNLPEHTERRMGAETGKRVRYLDAENDPAFDNAIVTRPHWLLAVLFLGAARHGHLPERVQAYFEDREERYEQLTPTWMQARITEWQDRPLRDFAIWLTEVLVTRSQRLALGKAEVKSGVLKVPTRVFVRDGLIFRDSGEGGGGVGLRWASMVTVLSGVGLVTHVTLDSAAASPHTADADAATEGPGTVSGWVVTDLGAQA